MCTYLVNEEIKKCVCERERERERERQRDREYVIGRLKACVNM